MGGATSYDGEEAWFFIDHLILSASTKMANREINVWVYIFPNVHFKINIIFPKFLQSSISLACSLSEANNSVHSDTELKI
jgi:hypothetical protein